MTRIKAFVNGRICLHGAALHQSIYVDEDSGLIIKQPVEMPIDFVNLRGALIAPAFLELQTNGCVGTHFTNFEEHSYEDGLEKVSKYLVKHGVGAFYVTLPTVPPTVYQKILPYLRSRNFEGGADLLGCHCEGPWLNPNKKGAHDAGLMRAPAHTSMEDLFGGIENIQNIKMITLAPELEGSQALIERLSTQNNIVVSLGHSSADYGTGLTALKAGAKALTHTFNAMNPLHHRAPGLAGLVASSEAPYFSLIADGIHLHPATLTMAYRSRPDRCILITDSIEMAGMPDGIYPGHAQIPHPQKKCGIKVTIEGTETLIGSCIGIDECVRNLQQWSGCSLPEAIRCATENIVGLTGDVDRGIIEPGRRGDFVVLDEEGRVLQTWIRGVQVFESRTERST